MLICTMFYSVYSFSCAPMYMRYVLDCKVNVSLSVLKATLLVSADCKSTFQEVTRPLVVIGTLLVAYRYCFAAPVCAMKLARTPSTYSLLASYLGSVTVTDCPYCIGTSEVTPLSRRVCMLVPATPISIEDPLVYMVV